MGRGLFNERLTFRMRLFFSHWRQRRCVWLLLPASSQPIEAASFPAGWPALINASVAVHLEFAGFSYVLGHHNGYNLLHMFVVYFYFVSKINPSIMDIVC